MSLGATYVKASDGYFYKDPILRGDDWFICFDEDDPPELVIDDHSKKKPSDVFREAKIEYSRVQPGIRAGRVFSAHAAKEGVGIDLRSSHSYYFDLKQALNSKLISEHSGRSKKPGLGVYYDFNTKRKERV